jgi:hypothetical protein
VHGTARETTICTTTWRMSYAPSELPARVDDVVTSPAISRAPRVGAPQHRRERRRSAGSRGSSRSRPETPRPQASSRGRSTWRRPGSGKAGRQPGHRGPRRRCCDRGRSRRLRWSAFAVTREPRGSGRALA